jgi:hypothetical protein
MKPGGEREKSIQISLFFEGPMREEVREKIWWGGSLPVSIVLRSLLINYFDDLPSMPAWCRQYSTAGLYQSEGTGKYSKSLTYSLSYQSNRHDGSRGSRQAQNSDRSHW